MQRGARGPVCVLRTCVCAAYLCVCCVPVCVLRTAASVRAWYRGICLQPRQGRPHANLHIVTHISGAVYVWNWRAGVRGRMPRWRVACSVYWDRYGWEGGAMHAI